MWYSCGIVWLDYVIKINQLSMIDYDYNVTFDDVIILRSFKIFIYLFIDLN
jgi:hypothetical protein